VLRLLCIVFDYLPCSMTVREEWWECLASVTVCNIELQNDANFSYCMHCIHPLYSIMIIANITITSIRYFTLRLFIAERYVTPPYRWSLIHRNQLAASEGRLAERWEWAFHRYQPAPSEATSTATSKARSTATSLLPAKPDPPVTACSQRSPIVREVRVSIPRLPACSQQSQIHCPQWSQIHHYQLAPSEARSSERWEWAFHRYQLAPCKARSTAPSEARSTATSEAISAATSLLPTKPLSHWPVKPDPPLPACSQRSHCHSYQQSTIHHYQLAPSHARLSERWEWPCQSSETEHSRGWKVNMSELCEGADQWWKWACQSWNGSKYGRVGVEVSMSELEWKQVC